MEERAMVVGLDLPTTSRVMMKIEVSTDDDRRSAR